MFRLRYRGIYLKVLVFVFLTLTISSCSIRKSGDNTDDWEKDVLLASECGQDGLACCVAPEEACRYGQTCCSDPGNSKINYCSNDCSLGKKNTFCRTEEPRCDTGLACSSGRCLECGLEDQPCCYSDLRCDSAFVCRNERCEKCGLPGNSCCEKGEACVGQAKIMDGRTECRGDQLCAFCGYGGMVSCLSAPPCNYGHLLNNETCFKCGELNSPCCLINESNPFVCNPEKNLVCELGFCAEKKW